MARWKAHAGELLSVEYVPHELQPLVLSASADCTVRLWTIQGHYIGTFGQVVAWAVYDMAIQTDSSRLRLPCRDKSGISKTLPHSSIQGKFTLTLWMLASLPDVPVNHSVPSTPWGELHRPNLSISDSGE